MLLKMFSLTFQCFIIHLRFIFVYYDCYVLDVLEIGQRATELTSPVYCYTKENKNYRSTSFYRCLDDVHKSKSIVN